jgi:hypothetical protein
LSLRTMSPQEKAFTGGSADHCSTHASLQTQIT